MIRRIRCLIRKEARQLRRDPVLLILIGWLYTVEVLLCAYALSFDLVEAPIAVVDRDGTPASRALADALDRSPYFRVHVRPASEAAPERLLDRGEVLASLGIPAGWMRSLHRGGEAPLQLLVDGSSSATAATVRGYAQGLIGRRALDGPGASGSGVRAPVVENRTRIWFNAPLKSVYFMVLSMIALAAMMVGMIHPAASLVREKEAGTIEQLMVSPMRPVELVAAKLFVTLAVSFAGLTASLGLVAWFEVPVRGSVLLFYFVSLVFQTSSIGLGILVATLSRNLQQALLLSLFGLLPIMFLSGTMVPIESMARPLQLLSLLSPLRYYMDAILGIFLKGNGLAILWPGIAAMAALGAVIFAASLSRVRGWIG